MGVFGIYIFRMTSLPWQPGIIAFLAFVAVSFLGCVVYLASIVVDKMNRGDQLMQRLTSACVSDKQFYVEGLEKKLLKVLLLENWYAK